MSEREVQLEIYELVHSKKATDAYVEDSVCLNMCMFIVNICWQTLNKAKELRVDNN